MASWPADQVIVSVRQYSQSQVPIRAASTASRRRLSFSRSSCCIRFSSTAEARTLATVCRKAASVGVNSSRTDCVNSQDSERLAPRADDDAHAGDERRAPAVEAGS